MKTSLQKRSLKAAGLALAIALGLALDNATAAISAISGFAANPAYLGFDGTNFLIMPDLDVYVLYFENYINISLGIQDITGESNYNAHGFTLEAVSVGTVISSSLSYGQYTSPSLPNNQYFGFAYGTGSVQSPQYHYGWVNVTASDNYLIVNSAAINTIPGESILAGQTTATAVPEPGTVIPAARLGAGAILRRRRPRSHRSGSATA